MDRSLIWCWKHRLLTACQNPASFYCSGLPTYFRYLYPSMMGTYVENPSFNPSVQWSCSISGVFGGVEGLIDPAWCRQALLHRPFERLGLFPTKDMQTPPPTFSFNPVYMKDAQCAESNGKSNFPICIFWVILEIHRKFTVLSTKMGYRTIRPGTIRLRTIRLRTIRPKIWFFF